MNQMDYKWDEWIGIRENEQGSVCVRLSDAVFQRHVKATLERLGLPTLTSLELERQMREIERQRFEATRPLHEIDYWLECNDPDVRVIRYPSTPWKGELS